MVDQQRSAFHSCKYLGPLHGSRCGISVSGTAFRTVQVRGIPLQFTVDLLLNIIDRRYLCCYDFVYLRHDLQSGLSMGIAIISFRSTELARRFKMEFSGCVLQQFEGDSEHSSACSTSWFGSQGFRSNLFLHELEGFFQSNIPQEYCPWYFDEHGVRISKWKVLQSIKPENIEAIGSRWCTSSSPKSEVVNPIVSNLGQLGKGQSNMLAPLLGMRASSQRLSSCKFKWRILQRSS